MAGASTQRHHLSPHLPLSLSLSLSLALTLIVVLVVALIREEGKDLAFNEEEVSGVGMQRGVLDHPHSPSLSL